MNNSHDDKEEEEHFKRIVNAFKAYRRHMHRTIHDKEKYIETLPSNHKQLLESYVEHLSHQKICVDHNFEIIKLIIRDVEKMFQNIEHQQLHDSNEFTILSSDLDKVQTTLKQIIRDWSEDGAEERRLCYKPIIDKVIELYPQDKVTSNNVHILVPGAGLGRLAFEFAHKGFTCQGNEFSLFMLFAANFVLNKVKGINSLRLYPWAHSACNMTTNADHLKIAHFPDVDPSELPPNTQFSMAAGDFLEIYTDDNAWDVIASCFFIDCANNIVAFVETIYKILKPGGHWVNLGPLLYHFAEVPGEESIEPSYEVLREIIANIGFDIKEEKQKIRTTYIQNPASMLRYEYDSVFFVAQKPVS